MSEGYVDAADGLPTDRGAAASGLLATLYPPPLVVRTGPASAGQSVRAAWTALPSAANPRLLVPAGDPTAAMRAVRRQLTGTRLRTRLSRAGLTAATASGLLPRMTGLQVVVTGPVDAASIEDPLREVLGVPDLRLTMPVGPARANRKPVLQVTDPSGGVLAFVKVGHNPLTGRLVRQEGETLRRLEAADLREVHPPRALASLRWHGHDVLLLEPLRIPARRLGGRAGRRRLLSVVQEIAGIGGSSLVEWGHHPFRAALLARTERCGEVAVALRRPLEGIDVRLPVPTGSWHGDLNSGNVALVPGSCPVWDWERFEIGVPLGFDLLHHDLHDAITVRGAAPDDVAAALVRRAPRTLAGLGVGTAAADAVVRTYLVTLACRYVADEQHRAGADLGRVQDWLIPALEGSWS